ncbi:MAG: hypothetical protein ACJART_000154 [Maribacter sp.]|jgi:hypothetical protein
MKIQCKVQVLKFSTINELPSTWTVSNYKDLLKEMDFDGIETIAENELKDICYMALTDYEPEEAAEMVLTYIFKDRLKFKQIQNLSHEMLDEKLWEEYADLSMHEDFFNVGQLLYQVFDGKFPHPEAVRFQVKVSVKKEAELAIFEDNAETPLIRLLVKGMPEKTLINRLFDKQLEGDAFTEAKDIIWQLKKEKGEGASFIFDVISSEYWFHDFKYVEDFDADTHADD